MLTLRASERLGVETGLPTSERLAVEADLGIVEFGVISPLDPRPFWLGVRTLILIFKLTKVACAHSAPLALTDLFYFLSQKLPFFQISLHVPIFE